jgi:hypothetical protein
MRRKARNWKSFEGVVNNVKYSSEEMTRRMHLEMDLGMVFYIGKSSPPNSVFNLFLYLKKVVFKVNVLPKKE